MRRPARTRWFRISVAAFLVGVIVGIVIAISVVPGVLVSGSTPDRPMLTSGGTNLITSWSEVPWGFEDPMVDLPQTAAEAVAAGWKDPILCAVGRGRYFQKDPGGEDVPYFLMYDGRDELLGVYLLSETEMPAPWQRLDELLGGGSLPVIDHEHWGLFVYFKDPARACTKAERQGNLTSRSLDDSGSAVRSAPTPYVAPTPTPTAGAFLESAATRMAGLQSLTFTLAAEPEGVLLMGETAATKVEGKVDLPASVTLQATDAAGTISDVRPDGLLFNFKDLGVTLGNIARAMQTPADTAGAWIDNVQSRGVSGTVLGEHLGGLVPSVPAEAQLSLQMWFSTDGLVRRVRIEGPLAPDDPPEAVRVIELRDFD